MSVRRVRNERLSDEEFFQEREEVLAEWPTGKDVDLDDGIEFHKQLSHSRVYARKLAEAKQTGDTLVHSSICPSRVGTPLKL